MTDSLNETILHSFGVTDGDGYEPFGGVASDEHGNLFGTTESGGENGQGSVFRVRRTKSGYGYKVIFGATNRGGYAGVGTVYRLTL
jgi:uncharacterized repeat protein (TIGR03803 family)